MFKISIRDLDIPYLSFSVKDLLSSGDMSDDLKNFLCLHRILYEEQLPSEARNIITHVFNELGTEIKKELLDSMERWLKQHTNGKHLFEWENYDDDKQGTWAWTLVNDGKIEQRNGFEFNLIPIAAENLLKLAREKYGKQLTKDDIEYMKVAQDELVGSYNSETYREHVSEDFREFIARKYTPLAFKAWQKFWGKKLIIPTKEVTEAVNRLKTCSMKDLPAAISLALSTYHVHGKMLEHIAFDQSDLDYLHNIPEADVEKLKQKLFGDEYSNMSLTASISLRDKYA